MKKYIMLIMVLFLCGCTATYQLEIDGSKITEQINIPIDNTKIVEDSDESPSSSIYSESAIRWAKEDDIFPIEDGDTPYQKKLVENGNITDMTLTYEYKEGELPSSRYLNECFENKKIVVDRKKISIELSGKYYCLDESGGDTEFKIVTKNKVNSANIPYEISDTEYTWAINQSNASNVDIQIEVSTQSKVVGYGVWIFLGIAGAIIGIVVLFAIFKIFRRREINRV